MKHRRGYSRRRRGGNIFKKAWKGIKKGVNTGVGLVKKVGVNKIVNTAAKLGVPGASQAQRALAIASQVKGIAGKGRRRMRHRRRMHRVLRLS